MYKWVQYFQDRQQTEVVDKNPSITSQLHLLINFSGLGLMSKVSNKAVYGPRAIKLLGYFLDIYSRQAASFITASFSPEICPLEMLNEGGWEWIG